MDGWLGKRDDEGASDAAVTRASAGMRNKASLPPQLFDDMNIMIQDVWQEEREKKQSSGDLPTQTAAVADDASKRRSRASSVGMHVIDSRSSLTPSRH